MRSRVIQQSFAEAPSWVGLRMARSRDCYSPIGECEGCKRWKSRVIIMCFLVGVVGFLLGLEGCCGVWGGERLEREGLWERRAQVMVQEFNLSKSQLQVLTVLLSSSEVNNLQNLLFGNIYYGVFFFLFLFLFPSFSSFHCEAYCILLATSIEIFSKWGSLAFYYQSHILSWTD
jgi:hypothetical protein